MNRKNFIITFLIFCLGDTFIFAQSKNNLKNDINETIIHKVEKGFLHKGGKIKISVQKDENVSGEEKLKLDINYRLKKRALLPVSAKKLRGNYELEIPMDFSDERGYLNLAQEGRISLEKADLVYLGVENVKWFHNCHKVSILPHNKKSKIIAYYHPSAKSVGWVKLELTLLKVPVISPYTIKSYLR